MLAVDLKDDPKVVEAYVEHHRRVWPEVLRSLQAAGIAGWRSSCSGGAW